MLPDIIQKNIYFDLDGTLVSLSKGKVKWRLVGFAYRCLNKGKTIFLLTKHPGGNFSLQTFVDNYKLNGLFSSKNIIHVPYEGHKYEHMLPDSVLIDDQKKERKEAEEHGFIAINPKDITNQLW